MIRPAIGLEVVWDDQVNTIWWYDTYYNFNIIIFYSISY